jgi:hypothetical protein
MQNQLKSVHMRIARGSGRIAAAYPAETICPCCNISRRRYDLEFQAITIENGQAIDSSYTVKNLCVQCLTVCDELPRMDFLCAKCGQFTTYIQEDFGSELELFRHLFSQDGKFGDFYERLSTEGLKTGKRYCMSCVYKIWHDYLKCPVSLQGELEKPKHEYALKKI